MLGKIYIRDSEQWYDCSKTALKNLRIAYNNSLQKLLGIPKYNSASEMFVCLNIPSFNELLRKYVYSFRSRIFHYVTLCLK